MMSSTLKPTGSVTPHAPYLQESLAGLLLGADLDPLRDVLAEQDLAEPEVLGPGEVGQGGFEEAPAGFQRDVQPRRDKPGVHEPAGQRPASLGGAPR